jgi:hypothetical protein
LSEVLLLATFNDDAIRSSTSMKYDQRQPKMASNN